VQTFLGGVGTGRGALHPQNPKGERITSCQAIRGWKRGESGPVPVRWGPPFGAVGQGALKNLCDRSRGDCKKWEQLDVIVRRGSVDAASGGSGLFHPKWPRQPTIGETQMPQNHALGARVRKSRQLPGPGAQEMKRLADNVLYRLANKVGKREV